MMSPIRFWVLGARVMLSLPPKSRAFVMGRGGRRGAASCIVCCQGRGDSV